MMIFTLLFLALSAIANASATIEAAIINRILQLDIGLQGTYLLLDKVDEDNSNVTATDIVVLYNSIVAPSSNVIEPLNGPCSEGIQFTLCQAYHSFVITSTNLYDDLAGDADEFNQECRNGLREGLNRIWIENSLFVDQIAPGGLPLCFESIQCDCAAFTKAFMEAWWALEPSTASQ
ncbi:hypothetical protein BDV18DRAFT_160532 [Aspergillus unguis]